MKNCDTNTSQAEVVALNALRFLAGEPERFSRFLTLSGLEPQHISTMAGKPEFLASVMDYFLADEKLLLEFAENDSLQPHVIVNLRQKLPGANHL